MAYPLLPAPTVRPVPGVDVGLPAGWAPLDTAPFTTITTPQTIENTNFSDGLTINHPGNPTPSIVRLNLFNGTSDDGAGPCIFVTPGSKALIYRNEIVGGGYAVGIVGTGYRAWRNHLHQLPVDGFKGGRDTWAWLNLYEDPIWPGGDPHVDVIQAEDVIRDGILVFTGNWADEVYADGIHHASSGLFSNPNNDPDTPADLGWFVAAGNRIAGGGVPIFAAMGDQTTRHFFVATKNTVVAGTYEYEFPIELGGGVDEPSHIVNDNQLSDGSQITVETTRKGELSRTGDDLIFTYTVGPDTGTVVNLGAMPAEFLADLGSEPPVAINAHWYASGLEAWASGSVNWASDEIRVSAHSSAYTPNQSTDEFFDDAIGELTTGNGYTAGGVALGTKSITRTGLVTALKAADTVWTPAAGETLTIRWLVIRKYNATASGSQLLGYVDLDADVSAVGAPWTANWDDTDGVLKLTAN